MIFIELINCWIELPMLELPMLAWVSKAVLILFFLRSFFILITGKKGKSVLLKSGFTIFLTASNGVRVNKIS